MKKKQAVEEHKAKGNRVLSESADYYKLQRWGKQSNSPKNVSILFVQTKDCSEVVRQALHEIKAENAEVTDSNSFVSYGHPFHVYQLHNAITEKYNLK